MTIDRERRLLEILDAILSIAPEERSDWLEQMCEGDAELKAEVEALMGHDDEADELLQVELTNQAAHATTVPPAGSPDFDISTGSQLGDFLIEQQLGAGGMGVVYLARQISLNRTVALKVLPQFMSTSQTARARFRREIEATAQLHHQNIVSVHATGEEGGRLFYAMELIDGPTLSDYLKNLKSSPIPELQAVDAVQLDSKTGMEVGRTTVFAPAKGESGEKEEFERDVPVALRLHPQCDGDYFDQVAMALFEVADGLFYAHNKEIIHRDVKPSNLLIGSTGRLHLSDFGLARLSQEPSLTRTGECVGTPLYMAPEQVSAGDDPVDHRVDVYAMGATLYELLTLRPPFIAESREKVLAQITSKEPIPPRRLNRRVPRDLQTICLKALEKDPDQRYQSAGDMASDLRSYVNRFSISARRSGPFSRISKWAQRHPGLSLVIMVATVLATATLLVSLRAQWLHARWSATKQQEVFESALMAALEGKVEDAKDLVDEAVSLGAPLERIHLLEGQVELMMSNHEAARQHFEKSAAKLPNSVTAQSLLAFCLLRSQEYDRGEDLVEKIKTLKPQSVEDYLYKARAEKFLNLKTAAATLEIALTLERKSLVARLIRGEVQTSRAMDYADPEIAQTALGDYSMAQEFLGATPLVSTRYMTSLLVASTAFELHEMHDEREKVLQIAAQVAADLSTLETTSAYRMRALYFDYIGDVEKSLKEWRKIRHSTVLFQAVTLFREGRFNEAKRICDIFTESSTPDRMMDFIQTLILSATIDSRSDFENAFRLNVDASLALSPIHELLTVYTMSCLRGDVELARRQALRLKKLDRFPLFLRRWYGNIEAYTCDEISADQLIESAEGSRRKLCEAYYYIAITELAVGNREAALKFFQESTVLRIFNFYEHHLSLAIAEQMKRDPTWPAWIP